LRRSGIFTMHTPHTCSVCKSGMPLGETNLGMPLFPQQAQAIVFFYKIGLMNSTNYCATL
jgi:hypothetical protein